MPREYVARWALVDALASDLRRAIDNGAEASREIAERLIEDGWRPGGDE